VRDADTGQLRPASWREAIAVAADGLTRAVDRNGAGVLTGGRLTVEDAYAYAKFARVALGSNDIDFRARPHSAEEADFLSSAVAGTCLTVSYSDLDTAPAVLLVGFEPEDESPIVFLRLRKAARRGLRVFSVAPWASRGLDKLDGTLLATVPGAEPGVLDAIAAGTEPGGQASAALGQDGAVILVGERMASVPGAMSAVSRLADRVGAAVAWVPRRAGDRAAVEAGALPGLLPGGRPVADGEARADLAAAWEVDSIPSAAGRDTDGMLRAVEDESLDALVIAGVDLDDLPDPARARRALAAASFVVSLEVRAGSVHEHADVVLPVAPVTEKAGTYVNWEGRWRDFDRVLQTSAMPDYRVVDMIADAMDHGLGVDDLEGIRGELAELDVWSQSRPAAPEVAVAEVPSPGPGAAVLSTWSQLLDAGRLQDDRPLLAGTARRPVARISPATAAELGVAEGSPVRIGTDSGAIELPVVLTPMPDHVVWVPTNSPGRAVRGILAAESGTVVRLTAADGAETAGSAPAGEAGES
jgi:NADH-quinone oxidoreductase subunit G